MPHHAPTCASKYESSFTPLLLAEAHGANVALLRVVGSKVSAPSGVAVALPRGPDVRQLAPPEDFPFNRLRLHSLRLPLTPVLKGDDAVVTVRAFWLVPQSIVAPPAAVGPTILTS